MDPSTGAVLADYSTPTFDPNVLASPDVTAERDAGFADFTRRTPRALPGRPAGHGRTFPPGSTFKVVTTTAVYNLDPALSNFTFPRASSTPLPNSNQLLPTTGARCAEATSSRCCRNHATPATDCSASPSGPTSCPSRPSSSGTTRPRPSTYPRRGWPRRTSPPSAIAPPNQAILAYSAIGQENVRASALSNALVAAGVADHGVVMSPYLVQQVTNSDGAVVSTHQPTPWMTAATPQAAAQVTSLMQLVVTQGTADGVGFSPAARRGSKDRDRPTGNPQANTDDWMIGFAPANDPKIAVAVVVPYQNFVNTGAGVAGPS